MRVALQKVRFGLEEGSVLGPLTGQIPSKPAAEQDNSKTERRIGGLNISHVKKSHYRPCAHDRRVRTGTYETCGTLPAPAERGGPMSGQATFVKRCGGGEFAGEKETEDG